MALANSLRQLVPATLVEWLWWPAFLAWAFLPRALTPPVEIGGVHVTFSDLVLSCAGVASLPWIFYRWKRLRSLFKWSFVPFTVFIAYALLTALIMADRRSYDFPYVVLPAVHAWFAMALPFALLCSLRPESYPAFGNRLALGLGCVALVYIGFVFFPVPGIRPYAYLPIFGLVRLGGPLGWPTVLPAVFVVGVSFATLGVQRLTRSPLAIVGASIFTAAILLCASRGGLLTLSLFFVLAFLRRVSLRRKVVILAAVTIASVFVFEYASPERLRDFSDQARSESYWSSYRAWTASPQTVVFGQGFGQIWRWYFYEAGFGTGQPSLRKISTEFGRVLYHPHSTVFYALAELGLLGLCLLSLAVGVPLIRGYRGRPGLRLSDRLAPGLLASLVIFTTDTMLLISFQLAAIWWTLLFLMAADYETQRRKEGKPSETPQLQRKQLVGAYGVPPVS